MAVLEKASHSQKIQFSFLYANLNKMKLGVTTPHLNLPRYWIITYCVLLLTLTPFLTTSSFSGRDEVSLIHLNPIRVA